MSDDLKKITAREWRERGERERTLSRLSPTAIDRELHAVCLNYCIEQAHEAKTAERAAESWRTERRVGWTLNELNEVIATARQKALAHDLLRRHLFPEAPLLPEEGKP